MTIANVAGTSAVEPPRHDHRFSTVAADHPQRRHGSAPFPHTAPHRTAPHDERTTRRPHAAGAARPVTRATTEGPYYFDLNAVRSDITEGRPGIALGIALTVTGIDGVPAAGARVDIWQCDAVGLYSGYAGQGDDRTTSALGETFLRGTQFADVAGQVRFESIWPGWYPGRTPHIHFKVMLGAQTVLTSRFFLPDALSEYLFTGQPAYRRAAVRRTLNSNDGILIAAGPTVLGDVREREVGFLASLAVVVDPQARPVDEDRAARGARNDRGPGPGAGSGPGREAGHGHGPGSGFGPGPGPGFGPPRQPDTALEGPARVAAMIPGQGVAGRSGHRQ